MGAAAIQCTAVQSTNLHYYSADHAEFCRKPESGDDDDWRTLSPGWVSPPGLNYYTTVPYHTGYRLGRYHDPPPADRIFVEMVTV